MKTQDVAQLDDLEKKMLEAAFDPSFDERKTWRIAVDSTIVAAIVIGLAVWDAPKILLVVVALTYLLVATLEKASWQRSLLAYRSLTQKLVHRLESIEGVSLTPDGVSPMAHSEHSERARRAAH
jgi:hypothetical protein